MLIPRTLRVNVLMSTTEKRNVPAVATAAHLERKLTGLRRALDALEPGASGGPTAVS